MKDLKLSGNTRSLMRCLAAGAILMALLPTAGSVPDASVSTEAHLVGTLVQGEVDDFAEFYAAWGNGMTCTTAIDEVIMVLTVEGAPTDIIRLDTAPWLGPGTPSVFATGATPAVIYAQNPSGCAYFTVEGVAVETQARYTIDVINCFALVLCTPEGIP